MRDEEQQIASGRPSSTPFVVVGVVAMAIWGAVALVVYTADVVTTRGVEPNGDVDHVVSPGVASVKTVRVIVLTGLWDDPGVGEIQAFPH